HPALAAEQRVDAPVAVAGMSPREQLQPLPQKRLLRHQPPAVTLRGTMLARQLAGPPFRDPETIAQTDHSSAPPLRAQKFPRATSLNFLTICSVECLLPFIKATSSPIQAIVTLTTAGPDSGGHVRQACRRSRE